MVKSGDDGSLSLAPFLKKCYEMVDDESTNSIISWSPKNDSFVIWDMTRFSVLLLPKYFKHSNYSSFIRQLNIYGFRKIDADRSEFANDGFIKDKKHLLKNISRRKNSQVTENHKAMQQQDSSVEPGDKIENEGLWKEIENLKTDRNALTQELVKLRQNQENADNMLLHLRDRVQGMEKNQQQMLSFLVVVVQSPGFLIQLLHPKENGWRMAEPGSIVEEDADDENFASDGMIVRYQPPLNEMHTPMVTERPQASNPSSDGMKDPLFSPEFMKLLMDENLSSFENHAPFILPEIPVESTWEQLLLASNLLQSIEDRNQDGEGRNAENEIDAQADPVDDSKNFGFLMEQVDKSQSLEDNSMDHGHLLEKSQNLEILTKKMAHLASQTNQKN